METPPPQNRLFRDKHFCSPAKNCFLEFAKLDSVPSRPFPPLVFSRFFLIMKKEQTLEDAPHSFPMITRIGEFPLLCREIFDRAPLFPPRWPFCFFQTFAVLRRPQPFLCPTTIVCRRARGSILFSVKPSAPGFQKSFDQIPSHPFFVLAASP